MIATDDRFKVGDTAEVFDIHRGIWRPARLMRHEPYPRGQCDGYYVAWLDLPDPCPYYLSTGGWESTRSMRPLQQETP